jgi:hypothetical protein
MKWGDKKGKFRTKVVGASDEHEWCGCFARARIRLEDGA